MCSSWIRTSKALSRSKRSSSLRQSCGSRWRPVSEHGRADLVLEIGGELERVQVKWGRLSPTRDTITVVLHTSRRTRTGHLRSTYGPGEVDLFAVYCGELDRCFLPGPPLAGRNEIRLRLTPARNQQHACINLADDFSFDGAVAQLARARGWQPRGQGFESPQLHSAARSRHIGNGRRRPVSHSVRALDRARPRRRGRVVTRRGKPVIRLTTVAPALPPNSARWTCRPRRWTRRGSTPPPHNGPMPRLSRPAVAAMPT